MRVLCSFNHAMRYKLIYPLYMLSKATFILLVSVIITNAKYNFRYTYSYTYNLCATGSLQDLSD